MANQPETPNYDAGVYQIEVTDAVQGGVGGLANKPLLNLANRTAYLYQQIQTINTSLSGIAPLNSPALTGTPTAPTPAPGDSSTKIATTAFTQAMANGLASVNVAGGSNVVLTAAQYGAAIIILTGALTANINVIFPSQSGRWIVLNSTSGAFSVTCKTAGGAGIVVSQGKVNQLWGDGTSIYQAHTDFVSPALTGTPTAPTPAAGDISTKIATTAFISVALNGFAPLASPALTGTPTAPTQGNGDNSTRIATTAFVQSLISAGVPHATTADSATNATNATNATHASSADSATNANHATSADSATTAASCSGNAATATALANVNQSAQPGGFVQLPGGIIIQWGSFLSSASGYTTVNFPIAFNNSVFTIVGAAENNVLGSGVFMQNSGTNGSFRGAVITGANQFVSFTVNYIAIGN